MTPIKPPPVYPDQFRVLAPNQNGFWTCVHRSCNHDDANKTAQEYADDKGLIVSVSKLIETEQQFFHPQPRTANHGSSPETNVEA